MQKLISKYAVAAHLALLAVAPLFLFPFFPAAQMATAELCLAAFAFVWVLMEPSRRAGEMLHDARTRVARAIIRDPLFWTLLALVVFAAVRWANGGVALRCDFNNGSPFWYLHEATCRYLPAAVSGAGYPIFVTAVTALVLVMGGAHALGKAARVSFLFAASTLAGVAALAAIALATNGEAAPLKAAWCGSMKAASFVGTAFGLHLLAGVAALIGVYELHWRTEMLLLLPAIGGNLAGLVFFAPTAVGLVFVTAAFVLLVASLVYAAFKLGITPMAKCAAIGALTLLLPLLVVMGILFVGERATGEFTSLVRTAKISGSLERVPAAPRELAESALALSLSNRFDFVRGAAVFPAPFAERRAILSTAATRIWRDHAWLGTGAGSYAMALRFAATAEDWERLNPTEGERPLAETLKATYGDVSDREQPEGYVRVPSEWSAIGVESLTVPFNGWWQLLSERGIVGALALALALGFLLYTFVRRLVGALGKSVFVPSCLVGPLALVALVTETFFDASFLRPEVLATLAAYLAVAASSFPAERKAAAEEDNSNQ